MFRIIPVLLLALTVLVPLAASAQDEAVLIADGISVSPDGILRASGNVEVLFQGSRLRASAITYSRDGDILTIEGPLSLSQGDDFVLLADSAALDRDFRNGVLTSARLVLDQQMQLAAARIDRIDGRYTQLTKAVASTCPVCDASEVPLWQIRSREIIHDAEKQRLYFKDALFEIAGIPVFYSPRLSMPDASVDRATGFLIPEMKNSSLLGIGIQVPYFIAVNPHADLTVTPYLSGETSTLGLRYRQLFRRGAIVVNGAVSNDTLNTDGPRAFLFGRGLFFLPNEFELGLNVEASSDDSYLSDYGISRADRLQSNIELRRVQSTSHFSADIGTFTSFRDDEDADTIPSQIADIDHVQKFSGGVLGGEAEYRLQAYGLSRASDIDITGRDYARLSAGLGWTRGTVFGPGLLAEAELQANVDHFSIAQDSTASNETALTAAGAATLRWPLTRTTQSGATEVLEPVLQFVVSNATDTGVPNEESTLVEFDEGNLWALDRLPGSSEYEIGNRINAGLTWTHDNPAGWASNLTVGRVMRDRDAAQFNPATGLGGMRSNWLISGGAQVGDKLTLNSRVLIDDNLAINRNDTRLTWTPGRLELATNFLWHIAEPEVGRDLDTWELHADAQYDITSNWVGGASMRYDFVANRPAEAGLSLSYLNPCLTVDFGFSRSFTSSTAVTPVTDFTIALSVPQGSVASKRAKTHCGG